MGYKTEINYIAKYSDETPENQFQEMLAKVNSSGLGDEYLVNNECLINFEKSGHRTFVLDTPIFLANHKSTNLTLMPN